MAFSAEEFIAPYLAIGSMHGTRLTVIRITVVGRQVRASIFLARGAPPLAPFYSQAAFVLNHWSASLI